MYFLRGTKPFTISTIRGCNSGSPPGSDTIGAPHSSTAAKHSSGESCFLRMCGGFCDGWDGASTPAGQNRARRGPRVGGAAEVGGGKPTQAETGLEGGHPRCKTRSLYLNSD